MGDVILATSVFTFLKNTYPDCKIWFITKDLYAGMFTHDTRLSQVVGISDAAMHTQLEGLRSIVWDRIIDLQHSRKSLLIIKKIGSKAPVALFQKQHVQRFFLLAFWINCYKKTNDVIARYLRAAGASKAESQQQSIPASLVVDKETCESAGAIIPHSAIVRPTIALFPFSAWKNKEWPARHFAFVGRYFIVKGWNVVISGGPADRDRAEDLCRVVGSRCVSTAGKLSLYEHACLISQCALALGNDSGLVHMARACGVKTGIVYGSTTWHFGFFPSGGAPFKVFEAAAFCRPCHAHGGNTCYRIHRPCLERVAPDDVVAGLLELYGKSSRPPPPTSGI